MKKLFVLLLMLMALATVAHADLTPPLDADGEPIVINTLMPYGDGLLIHYMPGETIYLSDVEDNWHAYPMRWENVTERDADFEALVLAYEELGLDTYFQVDELFHFVCTEDELLAVGRETGLLYRVTFESGEAVITYITQLALLPDKKSPGVFRIPSAFANEESLYLLTNIQDEKGNVADTLYAYDLDTWASKVIPTDTGDSVHLASAFPWKDGQLLVHATTNITWGDAGTYILNPANGKKQTLKDYFGVFSVPSSYVLAADAKSGVVILRSDDMLYSVSAEKGVLPILRMKDYSESIVFHPDGRLIRMYQTYADVVDPLQELAITQLKVLTGIHSAPRIQLNSSIPDIQLVTDERFAMEETEMDIFANAMTTQSSLYDVFILPIMQAESIIRKGYCVPMTGETAKAIVADMYPHMVKQLTNENGELVMVPVQLLRRQTIAYDMRAAELLGIDPADMPTTYEGLFEFMRNFEYDYGDLALEYDISLFDTSTARNIGTLRQRMVEDAIALSRVDRKALQANAQEIGALLDATLKLTKEVSDVVAPYFYIPEILAAGSNEPPQYLDEPAFLFTLTTSALPSAHADSHAYRYLQFTQPFELALTEDLAPTAIYSGYAMVVNPYSTKQDAALRYMNYVLANMNGENAADMLTTAEPVPSWYMDTYNNMIGWLANTADDPDRADYRAYLHELMASMEDFLYDIPQPYLDTYKASVEITQPVWLDVKESFAPCNAAWEQFLRGSIDGQQLLKRVLEVSQMIELE